MNNNLVMMEENGNAVQLQKVIIKQTTLAEIRKI